MPKHFDEKAYGRAGRELRRRAERMTRTAMSRESGESVQHICDALAGRRRIPPKLFAWLQA